MKDLFKLKKTEYKEGAELTFINAENHFQAALMLSEKDLYPFAITHIILSAEELVKAAILKIKSIDNNIKIDDLDLYFKNHTFKHQTIFKFYSIINEQIKFEEQIVAKEKEESLNGLYFLLGIILLLLLLLAYNNDETANELIEKDEINTIEKVRLSSVYVEFLHSRKWRSPKQLYNKNRFEGVKDLYLIFTKEVKSYIFGNKINNNNIQQIISKYKSYVE